MSYVLLKTDKYKSYLYVEEKIQLRDRFVKQLNKSLKQYLKNNETYQVLKSNNKLSDYIKDNNNDVLKELMVYADTTFKTLFEDYRQKYVELIKQSNSEVTNSLIKAKLKCVNEVHIDLTSFNDTMEEGQQIFNQFEKIQNLNHTGKLKYLYILNIFVEEV